MAQIKGFAIRGILKYVKSKGVAGGIPTVLAKLPADVAPSFKAPISSSSWYPYRAFSQLLRAVDSTIGKGDLALMPEIGRRSAQEDAGTIFKIITTIASVETIIGRSPIFWQRYSDTGLMVTLENTAGKFRSALKDFPEIDEAHCAVILGWIQGMGAASGAKTLTVKQARCVRRRDPWCEFEGTWSK